VKKGVETWVDRSPFKRQQETTVVVEEFVSYETPPAGTTSTAGHYRPAAPSPSPNAANETKRTTPYG
jgi:hypothetical protein